MVVCYPRDVIENKKPSRARILSLDSLGFLLTFAPFPSLTGSGGSASVARQIREYLCMEHERKNPITPVSVPQQELREEDAVELGADQEDKSGEVMSENEEDEKEQSHMTDLSHSSENPVEKVLVATKDLELDSVPTDQLPEIEKSGDDEMERESPMKTDILSPSTDNSAPPLGQESVTPRRSLRVASVAEIDLTAGAKVKKVAKKKPKKAGIFNTNSMKFLVVKVSFICSQIHCLTCRSQCSRMQSIVVFMSSKISLNFVLIYPQTLPRNH